MGLEVEAWALALPSRTADAVSASLHKGQLENKDKKKMRACLAWDNRFSEAGSTLHS